MHRRTMLVVMAASFVAFWLLAHLQAGVIEFAISGGAALIIAATAVTVADMRQVRRSPLPLAETAIS